MNKTLFYLLILTIFWIGFVGWELLTDVDTVCTRTKTGEERPNICDQNSKFLGLPRIRAKKLIVPSAEEASNSIYHVTKANLGSIAPNNLSLAMRGKRNSASKEEEDRTRNVRHKILVVSSAR